MRIHMEKQLYAWQKECLDRWLGNGGRGTVQAVTGSGKTILALTAASELEKREGPSLRVKIVVPTAALMKQWSSALQMWNENAPEMQRAIGLRGGGGNTPADRKYMIYVVNSARYELARQILEELRGGKKVLLIADECHRYAGGENSLIFEFLPHIEAYRKQFFSLGLSATLPAGQERKYLTSVLGKCIYRYGIQNALAAQTVCEYDIFHVELVLNEEEEEEYTSLTERMQTVYGRLLKIYPELNGKNRKDIFDEIRVLAGQRTSKGAKEAALYLNLSFKRKELVCLAEERTACAANLIKRIGTGQKILVFGERIGQAEELYRLLETDFPGKTGRYHSKMGRTANQNALERFRNGEIRILIACRALDEGVDIPDASVGIILSGTSVQRQRIQRLGRIIRKAEEKDRALLYYLHVSDSMEEQCFLPGEGDGGSRVTELQYSGGSFYQEKYDDAAGEVWERTAGREIAGEVKWELFRCLELGSVRADWMEDMDEIDRRIRQAGNVRERNYWLCMKRVAEQEEAEGKG